MLTKILSGALGVVIILLGSVYYLYTIEQSDNKVLFSQNEALKFAVEQETKRRQENAVLNKAITSLRTEFRRVTTKTRKDYVKLQAMLSDARLQKLLNKKPTLMITKMNKATEQVLAELALVGEQ
jgi:hypothetical protein